MSLEVRQIDQDGVEDFRKVLRAVIKDTGNLPMLPGIRDTVDRGNAFVGYSDGKPVAILTVSEPKRDPSSMKIDQLGAHPLRRGYGDIMFQHGLNVARERGKSRVFAYTKKENTPVHKLNAKHGMEIVGEKNGKYIWEILLDQSQDSLF